MEQYKQAIKLFEHLWRGGEYAMFWVNPGKVSHWFRIDAIPQAIKPDFSRNLYFGVNPCAEIPATNARGQEKPQTEIRAQLPYVAAINCLFAEFDAKDEDKLEILTRIRLLIPAPTVIIDSGGGYHCYWFIENTLYLSNEETREYARGLQRRWVEFVGGDRGAADLCRVLRVPGSRNWKPDYAPEFPEVKIVRWLNMEYSLHQLTGVLPPERKATYTPTRTVSGDEHALGVAATMIARASDGEKHYELLKAARLVGGYVAGGALSRSDAYSELCKMIDAKTGIVSKAAAYKTIEDGLDIGADAPIYVEDAQ